MSQQVVAKNINIAIKLCKCIDFHFAEFGLTNKERIDSGLYIFNLNTTTNSSVESKTFSVEINIELINNSDKKEVIASLKTRNEFLISNYEEIVIKVGEVENMPNQLIIHLLAISMSNTRGILSAKLEKTLYENAIIPLVDVSKMIPNQLPPVG